MGSEVLYARGYGLPHETGVVVDYDSLTNRYYVAVELIKVHPAQILSTRGVVNRYWAPVHESLFQRRGAAEEPQATARGLVSTAGGYWFIKQVDGRPVITEVPYWKRSILWLIGLC